VVLRVEVGLADLADRGAIAVRGGR
jgi:hypothetical protein